MILGPQIFCGVPAAGVPISSTAGIDLNTDFGQGVDPRKAPLPGMGNEILFLCRVAVAFTVAAGTPIAGFHAALSDTGNGVPIYSGSSKTVNIGSSVPVQLVQGAVVSYGYYAADLPVGAHFFIRFNPWTTPMGRDQAGVALKGKDLRYLGIILNVANVEVGSAQFATGLIQARLCTSADLVQYPTEHIYPAGVKNVG